jgi:hypothetical protein
LGVVERVVIAMIAFGLLASLLRLLMQQSALEQNYQVEHRGQHLDATTPGMTAEDLALGEQGLRGDQGDIS